MTSNEEGDLLLRVSGILPAEEFHPFLVRVARELGLRGWVRHDSTGALIRAVGREDQLVQLVRAIRDDAPVSLRVRSMDPDLITGGTPPVGDAFTTLPADLEWRDRPAGPAPDHPALLANVA